MTAKCANVAEAWRKRRYPKSFVSKLSDADAEATETQVWLDFSLRFGFISVKVHKELVDHYNHTNSQLSLMMAEPHKWTPQAERSRARKTNTPSLHASTLPRSTSKRRRKL